MEHAIKVNALSKNFGRIQAVQNLSFQVSTGQIFGLLGPNGSGKSTTIRMLCGLMRPTAGDARVLDYNIISQAEKIKQNIGYMNQKFSLYEDLTVMENMLFFGRIYGLSAQISRRRLQELKREMQLDIRENQLVGTLSGGWKQRVALACAFLHQPSLLILDEPTAGVDPVSRRLFWQVLEGLKKQGITILVTTHYMDEAERCDVVALMFGGQLRAFGKPSELMRMHKNAVNLEEVFVELAQEGAEQNADAPVTGDSP